MTDCDDEVDRSYHYLFLLFCYYHYCKAFFALHLLHLNRHLPGPYDLTNLKIDQYLAYANYYYL